MPDEVTEQWVELSRRVARVMNTVYASENLSTEDRIDLADAVSAAEQWGQLPLRWRAFVIAAEAHQAANA